MRLGDLLAAGLVVGIRGVAGRSEQFRGLALRESIRDVAGERVVAAAMLGDFISIVPDPCFPVYRSKMQKHAAAVLGLADFELAAIPEFFLRADSLHHPGE